MGSMLGYRALPGVADDAGYRRAHPPRFIALRQCPSRMDERECTTAFAYRPPFSDAGVFYRDYSAQGVGGGSERNWPISHVPVLIDDAEWQVAQRPRPARQSA